MNSRSPSLLGAAVLALLCSAAPASRAAILRVKADAPGQAHDGQSWYTAYRTIPAALGAAAPGDEVWVARDVYTGALVLRSGVACYGGFAGTETARDQRDPKAHVTVLDGNREGSVVTVPAGAGPDTVLDGFTVRNGTGHDDQGYLRGGGIHMEGASPTIAHNVITGNSAFLGGGISVSDGSPVLEANVISGNRAWGAAALHWRGGNAMLRGNTIRNNAATPPGFTILGPAWFAGAGVRLEQVTGEVAFNTISENALVYEGGALYAIGIGGGLYIGNSSLTVHHNVVTGNTMQVFGSDYGSADGVGIGIENGSTVLLENNLVAYNSALAGGDASISDSPGTASGVGVFAKNSTVTVRNNTIAHNTASLVQSPDVSIAGAGLYLISTDWPSSAYTVVNNVIAGNKSGVAWYAGTAVTWRYNDVHGNTVYDYASDLTDPTGTDGNISADPVFAGATFGDYRLLAGSPAIDTGDNAAVPAGDTDLDGHPRIHGDRVDMGAYEYSPVAVTMADVVTALRVAGGLVSGMGRALDPLDVTGADGRSPDGQITMADVLVLARRAVPAGAP